MKKLTLFTFVSVCLLVGGVYWSVMHRSSAENLVRIEPGISFKNLNIASEKETPAPYLPIPTLLVGWYAHRTSDSSYFVTKQEVLPDVGAVEGDAYGDQVAVSIETTTLPPQEWAARQQDLNDVLVRSKVWKELHEYQMLQIKQETEASPRLVDFLFVGNRVYSISLYPYSEGSAVGVFNDLLGKYASEPALN